MARKVRILSIDGGGVKGIAALIMLKKIMEDYNEGQHRPSKPCEVFDLICGASTGGLIAMMLGRLEYTVDDAIEQYKNLGEKIFGTKKSWWNATYDHGTLEDCLKQVIRRAPVNQGREDPELKYKRETKAKCRTFVVTTTLVEDVPQPVLLRDYEIRHNNGDIIEPAFPGTIWEAGRSTSAAPTYFKPITVKTEDGPRTYSDGGTIANCPAQEAIYEASRLWAPADIDLIISLGTGPEVEHTLTNSPKEQLGSWAGVLKWVLFKKYYFRLQLATYAVHAMTGTERLNQRAEAMIKAFQGPSDKHQDLDERDPMYYRLNIIDEEALGISLEAYDKMDKLEELAAKYMTRNVVALAYRKVIKAKLLDPSLEWNIIRTRGGQNAVSAQQLLKATLRIRLSVWSTSKPEARRSVRAVYNSQEHLNVISYDTARALVDAFEEGTPPDHSTFMGHHLTEVVYLNLELQGRGTVTEERIPFWIARDLQLPCDVMLGFITVRDKSLDPYIPFKLSGSRYNWYISPEHYPEIWGDQGKSFVST